MPLHARLLKKFEQGWRLFAWGPLFQKRILKAQIIFSYVAASAEFLFLKYSSVAELGKLRFVAKGQKKDARNKSRAFQSRAR
jgi:hypothetical protein